jgi:trehalose-phosphatase
MNLKREIPHFLSADPTGAGWRARLLQTLRARGRVLVGVDFDGTLSAIVPVPEEAAPWPGASEMLRHLVHGRGPAERSGNSGLFEVAVISGRGLADLRARLQCDRCWYVGDHGNEILPPLPPEAESRLRRSTRQNGFESRAAADEIASRLAAAHAELRPLGDDDAARLDALHRDAERKIAGWPGVRIERKQWSVAVHCRQAPRWEPQLAAWAECEARERGLRVQHGRRMVEFMPPDARHKGDAFADLMQRTGCGLAFYFGDDTSDEDVFRLDDERLIGIHVGEVRDGFLVGEDEVGRAAETAFPHATPRLSDQRSLGKSPAPVPDACDARRTTAADFWVSDPAEVLAGLREIASSATAVTAARNDSPGR